MKTLTRAFAVAALLTAGHAGAVTINFAFSSDVTDVDAVSAIPGTVTGRIVGLVDNATSAASAVYIDSYPATLGTIADPSYASPINVAAWTVSDNSFTLVNGAIADATFHSAASGVGGFDQFWLNIVVGYTNGNTNYFDAGNGNIVAIWNNNGLAGVAFTPCAVPEPAAWTLMIAGFGFVGAALRYRARTVAA